MTANEKIQLDTKSGDIRVKETSSSPSFDLSTVSGDAHGHFTLINGGDFNVDVKSGDAHLAFDSITPVSTITAKSVSGDVDINLVSHYYYYYYYF